MTIKDLKPGRLTKEHPNYLGWVTHSYNHMLSPQNRADGYKLIVITIYASNEYLIKAKVLKGGRVVGCVDGFSAVSRRAEIDYAEIWNKHRGRGLGLSAYEALFTHMYHKMGIRTVSGGQHSTAASKVHYKLSQKHGLKYPHKPPTARGLEFDGRVPAYRYDLE